MKHILLISVIVMILIFFGFLFFVPNKLTPLSALPQSSTLGAVTTYTGELPDSTKTPGAINPDVTQDTIDKTICVSGWTGTIRPPATYTTALKKKQLANGYALNGDMSPQDYEEDHLISLELGGNPTDEKNLWPEPYNITNGAKVKDKVENYLKRQVCSRKMTLTQAQYLISYDWVNVYTQFVK